MIESGEQTEGEAREGGRNLSRRRAEITMAERGAKEKAEREGEEGIKEAGNKCALTAV